MMDQHFMAANLIQVIETEDRGAVLLDLQTDRFFGLDQTGMLIWTYLTSGHTPQEVIRLITECYAVESEQELQEDMFQFLQHMQVHHLLLPISSYQEQRGAMHLQVKRPSFASLSLPLYFLSSLMLCALHMSEWLEAWLLLQWVHTFLAYGRLIDLASLFHALPTKHVTTYESPLVRRMAGRVQSAAAWQPFKATCLHQNLALGFLLKRRALQTDLVIGVSTFPFLAHAWLRSGSEIIHWETGLLPGWNLQRLHELSIIFCTEWF